MTTGKSRSEMGWVVMEVAMGDSCHPVYDSLIRTPAPRKPAQVTRIHRHFPTVVWFINYGLKTLHGPTYLGGGDVGEAVDGGGLQELPQGPHSPSP